MWWKCGHYIVSAKSLADWLSSSACKIHTEFHHHWWARHLLRSLGGLKKNIYKNSGILRNNDRIILKRSLQWVLGTTLETCLRRQIGILWGIDCFLVPAQSSPNTAPGFGPATKTPTVTFQLTRLWSIPQKNLRGKLWQITKKGSLYDTKRLFIYIFFVQCYLNSVWAPERSVHQTYANLCSGQTWLPI